MFSLKNIMRLNATSCLFFGLILSLAPQKVAIFLSHSNPAPNWLILSLGVILVFNGAHLIWSSFLNSPSRLLVLYFSVGDFIWVIASLSLVVLGLWVTTGFGIFTTLMIAILVGVFGLLQLYI